MSFSFGGRLREDGEVRHQVLVILLVSLTHNDTWDPHKPKQLPDFLIVLLSRSDLSSSQLIQPLIIRYIFLLFFILSSLFTFTKSPRKLGSESSKQDTNEQRFPNPASRLLSPHSRTHHLLLEIRRLPIEDVHGLHSMIDHSECSVEESHQVTVGSRNGVIEHSKRRHHSLSILPSRLLT